MSMLKIEWVPDTQLFDNPPVATKIDGFWKSCTPVPVVRLEALRAWLTPIAADLQHAELCGATKDLLDGGPLPCTCWKQAFDHLKDHP